MRPTTVEAVVEGGVLRPLKPLEMPEQQRVLVTIVAIPDEAREATSCYDLAKQLGVLGTAGETPDDLSTNPEHLVGLGS